MEREKVSYKRLCCDKTFTSRQSFYQHRRLVHSAEFKERREVRRLQEKERLENTLRMAERDKKMKLAVETISFIVKQHKDGNPVSLNQIPALLAEDKQQLNQLDTAYSEARVEAKEFKDVRRLDELQAQFNLKSSSLKTKMTDEQYKQYGLLNKLLDDSKLGDESFVLDLNKKIEKVSDDLNEETKTKIDESKRACKEFCDKLEKQIKDAKEACAEETKDLGAKFNWFQQGCDYLKLQNSDAFLKGKALDEVDEYILDEKKNLSKKRPLTQEIDDDE